MYTLPSFATRGSWRRIIHRLGGTTRTASGLGVAASSNTTVIAFRSFASSGSLSTRRLRNRTRTRGGARRRTRRRTTTTTRRATATRMRGRTTATARRSSAARFGARTGTTRITLDLDGVLMKQLEKTLDTY